MNALNKMKFDKAPKAKKPMMPSTPKGTKIMRKDAKQPVSLFKSGGKVGCK